MKKTIVLLLIFIAIFAISINQKSYAVVFYDTIGTRYQGASEILGELEVISGVKEGVFEPYRNVTRAEFTKMLVEASMTKAEIEAFNSDDSAITFKDVKKDDWFYKYVVAGVNKKLINGYENNTFKPNADITYNEIAKLITLALGHTYLKPDNPDGWEVNYLDKVRELKLFRFATIRSTEDPAIRGNVAFIIWNMLKAHTWTIVSRNETDGFTFVDSGKTLFSHKMIGYDFIENTRINGFVELNGDIYVIVNGGYFKLFDPNEKVNFSMIGGYSDVLLKRVEYPGEIVALEAVGIQTDVGATLYQGTYKELEEDGFELKNRTKLSKESDFAFIYHYDGEDTEDRTLALNLGKFYIVESIKVDDSREKDSKESEGSHSSVENKYIDDVIAYRYEKSQDIFTRTININDSELVINDGAVLFKNNERVKWSTLAKEDVLVEIEKDRYYYVSPAHTKETVLVSYKNRKAPFMIVTEDGEYDTYENTLYTDYFSNTYKTFNKMYEPDIKNVVGKKIKIYFDLSERVIRVDLLEDKLTHKILGIGIYTKFSYSKDDESSEYNRVTLWQDGKEKTYNTTLANPGVEVGDLVKYTFDEVGYNTIKQMQVIKGKADLLDKIRIDKIDLLKLQDKLKFFEEDEIKIEKITYQYNFGRYSKPTGYKIEEISIEDYMSIKDAKNTTSYVILDSNDNFKEVIVVDNTATTNILYGTVKKIYKEQKDDGKTTGKILTQIDVIGYIKYQNYDISNYMDFDEGDFIKFEADEKKATFIEGYKLSVLGYYKDLVVEKSTLDEKAKKVKTYTFTNDSILDVDAWKVSTPEKEYNLKEYSVFLLELARDRGQYWIEKASLVDKTNINLQKGDRIAFDEIEGTAIIYRGFEDE